LPKNFKNNIKYYEIYYIIDIFNNIKLFQSI